MNLQNEVFLAFLDLYVLCIHLYLACNLWYELRKCNPENTSRRHYKDLENWHDECRYCTRRLEEKYKKQSKDMRNSFKKYIRFITIRFIFIQLFMHNWAMS